MMAAAAAATTPQGNPRERSTPPEGDSPAVAASPALAKALRDVEAEHVKLNDIECSLYGIVSHFNIAPTRNESAEGEEMPAANALLEFAKKRGPRVIFGISGIGKTHLATQFPNLVFDMDRALDRATMDSWPALDPYDRRRAWRRFCQSRPWETLGEPLERWVTIRLRYIEEVDRILSGSEDLLVLTSELNFPWRSEIHVGVELGRYADHLRMIDKIADNGQDEAMNNRIEGFRPIYRLPPGQHLSNVPAIRAWLDERDIGSTNR